MNLTISIGILNTGFVMSTVYIIIATPGMTGTRLNRHGGASIGL